MAKRKAAPWFLRYGPLLIPFSLKGWAFFLTAIAALLAVGNLLLDAAEGARVNDSRFYLACFIGGFLFYFVVGYLKSEGPSVRTSAGRKGARDA